MAFSPAAQVSVADDTDQCRHVYVPGTTLSYVVTLARDTGFDRLWYRPLNDPDDFNNLTVPNFDDSQSIILPFRVVKFTVEALALANQVLFLFDDGQSVWSLVRNMATHSDVSPATQLFDGLRPNASLDNLLRLFYIRDEALQLRTDYGPEETLIQPSANRIVDFDTQMVASTPTARYAGSHDIRETLALEFRADADTLVVYDGETNAGSLVDHSGNNEDATYGASFHELADGGVYSTASDDIALGDFTVPSDLTLEFWWAPGPAYEARLMSGDLNVLYRPQGMVEFAFGGVARFVGRLSPLPPGRLAHVAVRHEFGDGSLTVVTVNGEPVPCAWILGTGDETPSLSGVGLTVRPGPNSKFMQMKVSDVALSLDDIRDYVRGVR